MIKVFNIYIKTNRIVFSGLLIACFLLSSNQTTNSASAASASITTNSSITLDTSSAGNGVSIDEESINVTTTCTKGYDLTIATSTSANLYLNGDSTKTAAYTAVNGTSALDSPNNTNKWGYTLTNNATASTVFSPLSTTASSIRTISQTTGVTSETIPIYYGIKTGNTVNPGTYSMGNNGTITYYLTMNPLCSMVDIAYDGNNADAGTMGAQGTGVIHTGAKDGDTVDLIASNFSRNGYGFAGWSLDKDAGTKLLDNDNTNNPIVYGPQESITLPEGFADNDTDNDGIVKLYAVWLQSQGSLQGWAGCANLDTVTYDSTTGALDLTKNSVTALTDMRDHDTYAVARLADGNCWMIENLRLEAEDTRGNNRFDSSITNESLAQGYGTSTTYGNFGGLAGAESSNFESSTANSLYYSGTQSGDATIDIGTTNYPYFRMPRYNNLNTPANASNRPQNPTSNTFANNNTTVGMYSYGNYYTWHAAIANTTHYSDGDHNTTSICPTGWQLPLGGTSTGDIEQGTADATNKVGGFSYLDRKMGGTGTRQTTTAASLRWRIFPNNFLYSGLFDTSSANGRGGGGFYWSSTARYITGGHSYRLSLGSSSVEPGNLHDLKYRGLSIRCTVPSNLYAVHFDANTTDIVTGAMVNQTIPVDEAAQLSSNSFQRPITSGAAYRFVKWNTEPNGSGTDYADGAPVTNLAAAGQTITLYAQWEQATPMTVNFNGNGLSFNDSSTTNTVYYANYDCVTKALTKYSHTPNIDDSGNQNGNYPNNANLNEVIIIPGASKLHIKLTYEGESTSWDWVSFWEGNYPSYTAGSNYSTGVKWTGTGSTNGKYGGTTKTTLEGDINGNTVTFAFKSDSGGVGGGYGYYAVITGLDSNGDTMIGPVCSRSLVTGEYKTPNTRSLRTFYGWSEDQSATTVDYATADGVLKNLPGNNGETKTLYAIWKNNLTINYNANGGTGTTASQTVAEGETITLKSNNFTAPANTAFGGWNTEPDGTGTSYSANTTFTAPNSVAYNDSLTLYAQWLPQYTITYVNNCQTYAGANASCTTTISDGTSEQKINLTNNPSTGTETGTLAAYDKWTLTGWKIKGWSTVADNSDNTNTEYGVGTTYTVPAGSSVGSGITLYAHWVPVYSIQYDGNGASNPNGMGTLDEITGIKSVKQTNVGEGDPVVLLASNFKKTSNGFAGWSTDPDAWTHFTDNDTTNDPIIYGPMETINAPAYPTNGTNIITMYAVWVPAEKDGNNNPIYLQEWDDPTDTTDGCATLTSTTFNTTTGTITASKNGIIALTDKRDDEVYTVAKLADNNCWMIENLRLEHEGTVGNNKNDTSVTNQSLSQGYGGTTGTYGNFVGLAASESANFSNSTTSLSFADGGMYKSSLASPTDIYNPSTSTLEDIGSSNWPGYRFPRYNNSNNSSALQSPTFTENYGNAASPSTSGTYKTSTISSYGNYYTWAAAMANTNHYKSSSTSEAAGTSICPSGWHLPSSNGTAKEYGTLSQRYGGTGSNQLGTAESGDIMSNRFRSFPNNFLYSGYFYGSSANNRGTHGLYWSRSAFNNVNSYDLYLSSTFLHPSYGVNFGKNYGFSVRCLVGS